MGLEEYIWVERGSKEVAMIEDVVALKTIMFRLLGKAYQNDGLPKVVKLE